MDANASKSTEQKAYPSQFSDGLWDIFFGLLLLANAAVPVLKALQLPRQIAFVLMVGIAPLVLILGKRYITRPRLGAVNSGAGKPSRHNVVLILIIVFLVITCTLWLSMILGVDYLPAALKIGPYPWMDWGVEALFLTGALWLVAYFLQFSRLYLYAVFVGFGFTLMELLYPYTREPLNAILAYGLPGTLVTAFGLIMLARFMSKYPPHKEPDNAQPQAGKD